jgi:hypothetical protein
MRLRITVRGTDTELRGYIDIDDDMERLKAFAAAMEPFGLVLASEADEDYDPFVWVDPGT